MTWPMVFALLGCQGGEAEDWNGSSADRALAWEVVAERDDRGMFMSAWGAPGDRPWIVGGSLSGGGVALRVGVEGDLEEVALPDNTAMLTWVHGSSPEDVWFAGLYGTLLHWDGVSWTDHSDPREEAFWGVHVSSEDEVVAVGGPFRQFGSEPILYAGSSGSGLEPVVMPSAFDDFRGNLFKVHLDPQGRFSAVGAEGMALTLEVGKEPMATATGTARDLVTVHGHGSELVAVGGRGVGELFEWDEANGRWRGALEVTSGASGVHVLSDGDAVVVGENGWSGLWRRAEGEVIPADGVTTALLHAVWVEPDEETVWAVGGDWLSADYSGTLLRGTLR